MKPKQLKKRIERIQKYTPYKKSELKRLVEQLINLENSRFYQPIHRFNKKVPVYRNLEKKILGRRQALSYDTSKGLEREKFPIIRRR